MHGTLDSVHHCWIKDTCRGMAAPSSSFPSIIGVIPTPVGARLTTHLSAGRVNSNFSRTSDRSACISITLQAVRQCCCDLVNLSRELTRTSNRCTRVLQPLQRGVSVMSAKLKYVHVLTEGHPSSQGGRSAESG